MSVTFTHVWRSDKNLNCWEKKNFLFDWFPLDAAVTLKLYQNTETCDAKRTLPALKVQVFKVLKLDTVVWLYRRRSFSQEFQTLPPGDAFFVVVVCFWQWQILDAICCSIYYHWRQYMLMFMAIIKVFIKHKSLSIETILSMRTHTQDLTETGQILNNYILDDMIEFSSTLFQHRTKTSWKIWLLQPCCTW